MPLDPRLLSKQRIAFGGRRPGDQPDDREKQARYREVFKRFEGKPEIGGLADKAAKARREWAMRLWRE